MGNGNLEYTVSQDTANSRHTVRTESYTSFAMPKEIVYGNFVTSTTSTADRTLSFVYGPEHQRVKETTALSGSGTSAYSAGSTWILNGEDSLGLSYEKEIQAGGMTEHKHYLRAGGSTFALFVNRTGTLGSKPATATSYFQNDNLGSLTVITDEAGSVVERLAYDPWGKRRVSTGINDKLDVLVGQRTDRGYTEHEHLDEIGVIHMNARIYDPLIGRFMSPDSWIDHPWSLQSYNRYAYVHNNPLKNFDPTGHETESNTDPMGSMSGYNGKIDSSGGVYVEGVFYPTDSTGPTVEVHADSPWWSQFWNSSSSSGSGSSPSGSAGQIPGQTSLAPPPLPNGTLINNTLYFQNQTALNDYLAVGLKWAQKQISDTWWAAKNDGFGGFIDKTLQGLPMGGAAEVALGTWVGGTIRNAAVIGPGAPQKVGQAFSIANASKLAEELTIQSAKSPFTAAGTLTQDALSVSKVIIRAEDISNPAIRGSGLAKYTTETFQSPAGDFQVHFYMNPVTKDVFYGQDYKAIFNDVSRIPR